MVTVGFIGMGIMGQGMAKNLITKAGRKLVIWNRSRGVADDFAKDGSCEVVNTPKEVIEKAQVIYLMLSDLNASTGVYEGENGVLSGSLTGKSIIDCATLTPDRMAQLDTEVTSRGGKFLEAPVAGSKGPAAQGTLVFMCAGSKEVFDAAEDELKVMGKASFFLGKTGNGSNMKLTVNVTMGSMMATLSEGLALASSAGLDQNQLLEVLDLSAVANPMFKLKGPKMVAGDYATNFPLKHAQKDMCFALRLGDSLAVPMPVAAAANEQFKRARGKYADDDFSAIHKVAKS